MNELVSTAQSKAESYLWLLFLLLFAALLVHSVVRWTSGVPEFYPHEYLRGVTLYAAEIALCMAMLLRRRRILRWSLLTLAFVSLAISLAFR
jgi:hypothetical protein